MNKASTKNIMKVVASLAKHENMRVTVNEALKAGAITGIGALTGALLGGRMGIAIGSMVGATAATYMAQDFKSVIEIINNELTDQEKNELANDIRRIFLDLPAPCTLAAILSNENVKNQVKLAINNIVAKKGYAAIEAA